MHHFNIEAFTNKVISQSDLKLFRRGNSEEYLSHVIDSSSYSRETKLSLICQFDFIKISYPKFLKNLPRDLIMHRILLGLGIFLGTLLTFSFSQAAQIGRTTVPIVMYAGPAGNFPNVGRLPAGVKMIVRGCTYDFFWCDVKVNQLNGWIMGDYIYYPYLGKEGVVSRNGSRMGIPVISYSASSYWSRYYRGNPWYNQRNQWDKWQYQRGLN